MQNRFHPKNIFANIPADLESEVFETLGSSNSVRIERILSKGHQTPEGSWYDQAQDEWVMVLKGSATLEFEGGTAFDLVAGDYLNIPAHAKHRVSKTSSEEVTVWFAVFY